MSRRAGVLGLIVVVVAGCGSSHSSSNSGDVAKIKSTVTRAFAAIASGDAATACSLATPAGQSTFEKLLGASSCTKAVAEIGSVLTPQMKAALKSAQVKKVSISGNTATIKNSDITAPQANIGALPLPPTVLVKQPDGSWKLNS